MSEAWVSGRSCLFMHRKESKMIRLFLLGFARSLRANKVLSLINVLSLGLGLTVFAIALLYVQRELSYDREWPNVERIHRLVVERRGLSGEADGFFTRVSPRDSQALLDYFPASARYFRRGQPPLRCPPSCSPALENNADAVKGMVMRIRRHGPFA